MSTPFADAVNTLFGSNLRRLWKLHETSGAVADDATDNQDGDITGATLGQAALSQDTGAASMMLDGVDDDIVQASEGLFNASATQPITIGIIFRSGTTQADRVIAAFERLSSSRRSLGIYADANGDLAAAANYDTVQRIETGNIAADDDQLHLLIAVVNGANDFRFYVDDALDGSNSASHGTGTSGTNYAFAVGVGPRPGVDGPFPGYGRAAGNVEFAFLANQDVDLADVQALWAALTSGGGGPDPITGELDATFPALTSSGSGAVDIEGSAAATSPAMTASGAGSVKIEGSIAATFPAMTSQSSGEVDIDATSSQNFPAMQASAAGSVGVEGSLAATLPAMTSSGAGSVGVEGSLAATFPVMTMLASAGEVLGDVLRVTGTKRHRSVLTGTRNHRAVVSGTRRPTVSLTGVLVS